MNNLDELWAEVVKAQRERNAAQFQLENLIVEMIYPPKEQQECEEAAYFWLVDATLRLNAALARYDNAAQENNERALNDRRP